MAVSRPSRPSRVYTSKDERGEKSSISTTEENFASPYDSTSTAGFSCAHHSSPFFVLRRYTSSTSSSCLASSRTLFQIYVCETSGLHGSPRTFIIVMNSLIISRSHLNPFPALLFLGAFPLEHSLPKTFLQLANDQVQGKGLILSESECNHP